MPRAWTWAVVFILFGVLLFFSTNKLTESPPTWFDEGVLVQVAMNSSLHGQEELQVAPGTFVKAGYVTGGFTFLKPISWSFDVFGVGLLQARGVMVLFILATAAIFFALAYEIFGLSTALLSLLLLVTFPPLYGQGKNVLGEVPGLFYLGVFLYATHALEKRKYAGTGWYVLAGLSAGLCVATKPIFLLLGLAVCIGVFLYRRSITFNWPSIALGATVFLIPCGYWVITRFGIGDSAVGVLSYYANPYGIENIPAEISANVVRFFREASPLYFLLIMAGWATGVGVRLYKKEKIAFAESIVFIFSILVFAAYMRTAGWYRYFFLAEIPALIFFPAAAFAVTSRLSNPTRWKKIVVVFIVLLAGIQTYQLLFTSWVAGHNARTTTRDIETYMSTLPTDGTFFVYNTPAAVVFVPSQKYYQYLELNSAVAVGKDQLPALLAGTPEYLLTDDARWQQASSSFSHYHIIKTIDALIIATSSAAR